MACYEQTEAMEFQKVRLDTLPHHPGVYRFLNQEGTILYIGKAIDLFRRVHQYFQNKQHLSPKTSTLVEQIHEIEIQPTNSEFDALLLEAHLIHEYSPKYNAIAKDDKSPLYILLTLHEELPRVTLVRRSHLPQGKIEDMSFGPFSSAAVTRSLLGRLRRVTPFCTQKKRDGRPCFYTHLGLCGPCPSVIEKMSEGPARTSWVHQYRRNIFRLRDILLGKAKGIIQTLEDEMRQAAKNEQFEQAALLRNHLRNLAGLLERHFDPTLPGIDGIDTESKFQTEEEDLLGHLHRCIPTLSSVARIECVDISNTGGRQATGSLVVLSEGVPDTSWYRRFRIKLQDAPNDVAMIAEVLRRRFRHSEWPKPNLLVVDGGKGQIRKAMGALAVTGIDVPLVGLAKRREEIVIPQGNTFVIVRLPLASPGLHLLQRIRDEAHRFALRYHRLLRTKAANR